MVPTDIQQAGELLGVAPSASPEVIQAAYRARVRETHPDRGGDAAAFQQVKRARVVLEEWREHEGPTETPAVILPGLWISTTWLIAGIIGGLLLGLLAWWGAPWTRVFAVLLLISWLVACVRWSLGRVPVKTLLRRILPVRSREQRATGQVMTEKT